MVRKDYDIVAIGAHPDDVEVGCGGVLIDAVQRGYRVGVIILTKGEMGTGGNARLRMAEAKNAAAVMGVDILKVFDWGDTKLEDSYSKRLALAKVIRGARPQIVLAPYPHPSHGRRQSHPDHVAAGLITINAVSLALLKKANLPGEPHTVTRIFHFFLPPRVLPTFVVDITPHYEQWLEALKAHTSQFLNPQKSKDYLEHITAMARSFGLHAGCRYAHGFYCAEPVVVHDLMDVVKEK